MRKWAATNGVTVNLETETEAMLDHHRRHGNLWVDWIATWRTWMRNSVKFEKRNGGNGNGTNGKRERTGQASGANLFGGGEFTKPYIPRER
jgi:hypothetical protein